MDYPISWHPTVAALKASGFKEVDAHLIPGGVCVDFSPYGEMWKIAQIQATRDLVELGFSPICWLTYSSLELIIPD